MDKTETLDAEILGGIQPFQGIENRPLDVVESGRVMRKVETAYTTAVTVQKPRSLTTVVKNVLEEARLARSAFYYKWTVKGKRVSTIQGGSIDLARSIARNFGNVAVDISEEPESMTHFRFKATFIDLESGLNWPRLFRQRKSQNTGMADKERQEDIIYQIGQSKAQRNAVFQGVPGWLVDKAIEVAEQAEIDGIKDEGIEIARVKVIEHFSKFDVDQDRIEFKLGKKMENWGPGDIADLRAAATAIKEGRERVEVIFPIISESAPEGGDVKKEKAEKPKKSAKKSGRPKGSKKKKDTKETGKKPEGDGSDVPEKVEPGSTGEPDRVKLMEDLINSEVWADLMELKKKSPKHAAAYLRVTRGRSPESIDEAQAIIDEINVQVADSQDSGIPGA